MNRLPFWVGVGLVVFGLYMAVLGCDTPQQIRGLAEMLLGCKLTEIY